MKKRKNLFKILLCLSICLVCVLSFTLLSSASEGESVAVGDNVGESVFSEIYRLVCENSADILSLLSFAASITVALFCKYALSPLIKGGLDKITSGVKSASGEQKKDYESLVALQKAISEKNLKIEEELSKLSERVGKISDGERQAVEKSLLTVITSQVNMLNEIFQSSALPHYQKEAVGNMINEMKSELAKNEARDKKD